MLKTFRNYFQKTINKPLSKQQREKRFPKAEFQSNPLIVRKTGLSTNEISAIYIYQIIEKYFQSIDKSNHRYAWMQHWLPAIKLELETLNKYTLEDVGRVVIIQNEKAIFDFYLIYDIHIHDLDYVVINLNDHIEDMSYFSKIIASAGMILSIGSISYFLSNLL